MAMRCGSGTFRRGVGVALARSTGFALFGGIVGTSSNSDLGVTASTSGASGALTEGGSLPMSDILLRAQVRVQTTLYSLRHRQEGQGLVEYGLIIASIAILLIIAMLFLAGKIDDLFSKTGTSVDSPGPLP